MKLTSTLPPPYFFYPGTDSQRRPARRRVTIRHQAPTPVEDSDELGRKQEIVCGVILAVSQV